MGKTLAQRLQTISPFYVMALLHRAKELAAQGRDVIHMEVGEPDFPTPQPIVDAAINLIKTGEVKYTSAAGLPQLRQKSPTITNTHTALASSRNRFLSPQAHPAHFYWHSVWP